MFISIQKLFRYLLFIWILLLLFLMLVLKSNMIFADNKNTDNDNLQISLFDLFFNPEVAKTFHQTSDFDKALMLILTVVACVLSILGLAYIVKYIIFQVYLKCSNAKVQEAVRGIIYELDKVADEMSNKEKRKEAIRSVHDLFIWRTIPIPAFVIGIIIDGNFLMN